MKNFKILVQLTTLCCAILATTSMSVFAQEITLKQLSTGVNRPIGIDYYEPNNTVVGSINYSSGLPYNFAEIKADGSVSQFSTFSGLTNEVKIATVRSGNVGGFVTGDFFTGTGADGQIAKITDDGNTIINPFVDLPGAGNGLMRGSLYVDRTGVYGGDLIAVTTTGEVWQIDKDGNPNMLADVNIHLEGLITVPNDVAKYGLLAGKIIAGAEDSGSLYTFDASGFVAEHTGIGVNIEDIDMINANENFFGMNFGTNSIFGADASEFAPYVDDILLTQEFGGATGLYRLFWDGTNLQTEEFTLAAGSDTPGQWEHVTFAPAGVGTIPPIIPPTFVPEPGVMIMIGLGLIGLLGFNRKGQNTMRI